MFGKMQCNAMLYGLYEKMKLFCTWKKSRVKRLVSSEYVFGRQAETVRVEHCR